MVAATDELFDAYLARMVVECLLEGDGQLVTLAHRIGVASIGALEPQDRSSLGNGCRMMGIDNLLDDATLRPRRAPLERILSGP